MALETGTYISDLVSTNPVSGDPKSAGDDHLRLLKSTIKTTFPNVTGAVTPTHTELNYVDGVTSALQTQLDAKAPLASPNLTGVPTAPTADVGASGDQIATLDFVAASSFSSSLPSQTGNEGKLISTDGLNAIWSDEIDTAVVSLSTGGDIVGTTETQTLSAKTLSSPILCDSSDTTKKANLILSGVTAGQNRNITVADENIILFTPYARLLSKTVVAAPAATVDLETTFDSTYDTYIIEAYGIMGSTSIGLAARFKIGGSYITTSTYGFHGDGVASSSAAPYGSIVGVSGTTSKVSFTMKIHYPSDTGSGKVAYCCGVHTMAASSTNIRVNTAIYNTTSGAMTGIRFFSSSGGTIDAGTFILYGVRSS